MNRLSVVCCYFMIAAVGKVYAQQLSPELVDAVRLAYSTADLRNTGVTVALVGSRTLPLIEVTLNGRTPARLLLDLGSNVTLLRADVARRSGTQVLVDRARSDIGRVTSIEFAGAVFHDVTIGIYDELDVDGVIGYNMLREAPFVLDYPAMRFAFRNDSLRPNLEDVVQYVLIDRMPFIPLRIGNDVMLFNLDTGAAEELTMPATWETRFAWAAAPQKGPITSNNQTGQTTVRVATLRDSVEIGRHALSAVKVYLNPAAELPWLGSALLSRFALAFDPTQRLVRFTKR